MKAAAKIPHPRKLRHRLGLNQQQFWSAVGVTQSGGSRYESGRGMPSAVSELVRLVHIEGIDLARVKGEHFLIACHLQDSSPALYRKLRGQVRAKAGHRAR